MLELARYVKDVKVREDRVVNGERGATHAARFVAERSGLIRSAVVTMSTEAQGQKADLEVRYRLRSTNRTVAGL
jgi:hypothetical protein